MRACLSMVALAWGVISLSPSKSTSQAAAADETPVVDSIHEEREIRVERQGPASRELERPIDHLLAVVGDADTQEVVEQAVEQVARALRQQRAAAEGRDAEQPQRARANPPRRERAASDGPARRRHVAQAIEHLQAAGFHDMVPLIRARLERAHPEQPDRRFDGVAQRDRPSSAPPGLAPRNDERFERLAVHVERLQRVCEELQAQVRQSEAGSAHAAEVHQRVDEMQRHMEQSQRRLEQAVESAMVDFDHARERLEKQVMRRMEQFELQLQERQEDADRLFHQLERRLEQLAEQHEEN